MTSVLDQRPDLDVLLDQALATGGETSAFDFKELLDLTNAEHKLRLVRTVGAFTNCDRGGYVIIGISDGREVIGLDDTIADQYDQTRVHSTVAHYYAPAPAIQVRHHVRDGKRLVIIEVGGFSEVPSVVVRSETSGKEKILAGTILARTEGAESSALTTEAALRRLCDSIVARKATALAGLLQRARVGIAERTVPAFDAIPEIRKRADEYWTSNPNGRPYVEVYFSPHEHLRLGPRDGRDLVVDTAVPIEHGFPFHAVGTSRVEAQMPWGWLGVIPFFDVPQDTQPTYLWLLARTGAFLDREHFWEDNASSTSLRGGVGLLHVVGKLVMLVRFLDRLCRHLEVRDGLQFTVGVVLNNVAGRHLEDEQDRFPDPFRFSTTERRIEHGAVVSLQELRNAREELVLNLLEEVVWQFRRTNWNRQRLAAYLASARRLMGEQYAFPENES